MSSRSPALVTVSVPRSVTESTEVRAGAAAALDLHPRWYVDALAVLFEEHLCLDAAGKDRCGESGGPDRIAAAVIHPSLSENRVLTGPDQMHLSAHERHRAVGQWSLQDHAVVGVPQDRLDADLTRGIVETVLGELPDHRAV